MNPLQQVISRCKATVHLTVNDHRAEYRSVEDYFQSGWRESVDLGIAPDVLAGMVATDTIIELTFYPDTPIGSYSVWHHDLDVAIQKAIRILDKN